MNDSESANAQDARLEGLWRALDCESKGKLDIGDLKKGLKKMDHRTTSSRTASRYMLIQA
jgi:Ca2+-binding EF-hand superfamily protein